MILGDISVFVSDTSYERILSVFVGSYYVNVQNLGKVPQKVVTEDLVKTRNALGNYLRIINNASSTLISLVKDDDDGLKEAEFSDLLDKPLGSVPSIIFWSDQQVELINNITKMKHTLLMGDYGTGELCSYLLFIGKITLDMSKVYIHRQNPHS